MRRHAITTHTNLVAEAREAAARARVPDVDLAVAARREQRGRPAAAAPARRLGRERDRARRAVHLKVGDPLGRGAGPKCGSGAHAGGGVTGGVRVAWKRRSVLSRFSLKTRDGGARDAVRAWGCAPVCGVCALWLSPETSRPRSGSPKGGNIEPAPERARKRCYALTPRRSTPLARPRRGPMALWGSLLRLCLIVNDGRDRTLQRAVQVAGVRSL